LSPRGWCVAAIWAGTLCVCLAKTVVLFTWLGPWSALLVSVPIDLVAGIEISKFLFRQLDEAEAEDVARG
jgi:hypothetical protein